MVTLSIVNFSKLKNTALQVPGGGLHRRALLGALRVHPDSHHFREELRHYPRHAPKQAPQPQARRVCHAGGMGQ